MTEYKTFEEWKKDKQIFKENPNDKEFLAHLVKKVENSSPDLREQIREEILQDLFEKDPYRYILMLSEKAEGKYPVIKSKDDIWFEV